MGIRYVDRTIKPTPQAQPDPVRQEPTDSIPAKYAGANPNHLEQLADEVLAGIPEDKALTIINRAMRDPQFTGITKDSLTFHRIHFDDGWYE